MMMSGANGEGRPAAFFDLDGTLARSNAVRTFFYFALAERSAIAKSAIVLVCVPIVLACVALERVSRRAFNRAFYALYRWLSPPRVRGLARACADATVIDHLFQDAVERVEWHRARGDAVVLVTGALDVVAEPVAARLGAEAFVANELEQRDGRFTGRLARAPLVGETKAEAVRSIARARGYDLARSFAYADHASDVPFLETVGTPVVAHADRTLAREARRRGWRSLERAP
jgi:HAD superfamily hydrolase (TIGR01490 family)